MLADYCWILILQIRCSIGRQRRPDCTRAIRNLRLDVVQVRDDSSKTVANEHFYCDFRVQHLNLHKSWHI